MKNWVWFLNDRRAPRNAIYWFASCVVAIAIVWLLSSENIPGEYQNAIKLANPVLISWAMVSLGISVCEVTMNRRRNPPDSNPDISGVTLLTDDVRDMCSRYDAWCFGENASGASARYDAFVDLVTKAKIYSGNTHRMCVYFDEDRRTVIFRAGEKWEHMLHELTHIYQEVAWSALSIEREGRVNLKTALRAEREATKFAGQRSWYLGWTILPWLAAFAFLTAVGVQMISAISQCKPLTFLLLQCNNGSA